MIGPESDVDDVIEGLQEDAGKFVQDVEGIGSNRLRVTGAKRGPPVYPETVLEYLALAGWRAERTDHKVIDGEKYPVVEFVRGDELASMAKRHEHDFETVDLDRVINEYEYVPTRRTINCKYDTQLRTSSLSESEQMGQPSTSPGSS